jgi:hypothetical protein
MRKDKEVPQPVEPEDYVPPALNDLGAFEEITKLGSGIGSDIEGTSGGPPV